MRKGGPICEVLCRYGRVAEIDYQRDRRGLGYQIEGQIFNKFIIKVKRSHSHTPVSLIPGKTSTEDAHRKKTKIEQDSNGFQTNYNKLRCTIKEKLGQNYVKTDNQKSRTTKSER